MRLSTLTSLLLFCAVSSITHAQSYRVNETLSRLVVSDEVKPIMVLFPGYSVEQNWAETWAMEMLKDEEVKDTFSNIFVFKGPKEVFYNSQELTISALFDEFKEVGNVSELVVVAHSSGSFPAHIFFRHLQVSDLNEQLKEKVLYVNLDGGIGENENAFSDASLDYLKKGYSISALDTLTNTYSANHESMIAFAEHYPEKFEHILLRVESPCEAEAQWCLHDVFINQQPHNKAAFDLEKDYSQYDTKHPINLTWLHPILDQLKGN
ncbi:hypothetical protein [Sediminitomix flava]|uniref:Alpha/beta hydrolase n=1 Tax=Sediminitomix flava TaxID=379075 RepID=A0A315Z8B9_SEDFL|nr:hypothetical protein [Sediminitomix flava]PWJ40996.1 hypothetical protein BC781_104262 [Sediminitomix flava]